MKLTFTYANKPDLADVPKHEQYEVSLIIPNDVEHLLGIQERILGIAQKVADLTIASLWLTCKPLGFDKKLIVAREYDEAIFYYQWYITTISLYFQGHSIGRFRRSHQTFQILGVEKPDLPDVLIHPRGNKKDREKLPKNLWQLKGFEHHNPTFYGKLTWLKDQLEVILNPNPNEVWRLQGVHPYWKDYNFSAQYYKKFQAWQKSEAKKAETKAKKAKAEEKKIKLQAKSSPQGKGKTGNTRHIGAVPGVFRGVQFRSQLEIRFATELEARGIDWIYEPERLGQGNYLVDFYLPQYKTWVEVKGQFEARDHFLLKDVAETLEHERNEEIFVYTSRKCYQVTSSDFIEMSRDEFWNKFPKQSENLTII